MDIADSEVEAMKEAYIKVRDVQMLLAMTTRNAELCLECRATDVLVDCQRECSAVASDSSDQRDDRRGKLHVLHVCAVSELVLITRMGNQVEQAMKRPKTAIDRAMELSPLKPRTLLEDEVRLELGTMRGNGRVQY